MDPASRVVLTVELAAREVALSPAVVAANFDPSPRVEAASPVRLKPSAEPAVSVIKPLPPLPIFGAAILELS
jgi:hypothetical protein